MKISLFRAFGAPSPEQMIRRELLAHQRDLIQAKVSLAGAQSVVQYRQDVIRELESMLAKHTHQAQEAV